MSARSAGPDSWMLSVGGVDFRVNSDMPLPKHDIPAYLPFVCLESAQAHPSADIDVEVLVGALPQDDLPVLFDSQESWTMQLGQEGSYRLRFRRTDEELPHTVVCSDSRTTSVRVHMHQRLVVDGPRLEAPWNPLRYPLDQLLLVNHLAPRGGILVHAAGVVAHGRAVVFPGRSGAGKSSLSRLFMEAGLGECMLSDDRIVIRTWGEHDETKRYGGRARAEAWGTPWPGDAGLARNACAPLAALYFLVQAAETSLVPLDAGTAMRRLLPVVSVPWYDAERGPQVMSTCAWLVENFPCFDLRFRLDQHVVETIMEGDLVGGAQR